MFRFGKKRRPKAYLLATTLPGSLQGRERLPVSFSNLVAEQCPLPVTGKLARRAKIRIGMVAVCFGIIFTGLSVRLAQVSFQPDERQRQVAHQQKADGPRPEVFDRNNVLLATNLPTIALEVAGKEVWDAHETAQTLAGILDGVEAASLERKLARGLNVEVRSDLSPKEQSEVFALGLPGVRFSRRDMRFYPQGGLAPHIVGYLEKGPARMGEGGIMGLEKVLDRKAMTAALTTSIDLRAQQVMEEVLRERMTEFSAEAAWGGVMDVQTGEIIASASLPEFDLNEPLDAQGQARRNRMTYDRFELGSAFKVITAASIVEAGLANEDTPYDARGGFRVRGFTIKDFHGQNRILTLSEVVQHSSNIGVARMAGQMGPDLQQEYLQRLGFFDALPIELSENRKPDLPKRWGPVEAATVSYGHGIAVTPLHLLAGFAATLNDGIYRVPTYLRVDDDQREFVKGERVFSEMTTASMRRVLRRTIMSGTAKRAEVEGYYPIGKTATADKPGAGGYQKNARISSFVGAFPGYNPRYAIIVSLDNPQPTKDTFGYATAGWTAAPAFHDVVERLGPILDVPMVGDDVAIPQFLAPDFIRATPAPDVDDNTDQPTGLAAAIIDKMRNGPNNNGAGMAVHELPGARSDAQALSVTGAH